jgi:hypothetical protein
MKITVDLVKRTLLIDGAIYWISCRVRALRDGTRGSGEVVRSIPDNKPYDPRPFPCGLWNVIGVEWQKEKGFDYNTYGPVKIRTNAQQAVNVWELDMDGDYLHETDRSVADSGYLLHYSKSSTTLGCIRLESPEDATRIAEIIERGLSGDENVQLEVI